jgi:hypothetical protein
VRPEALIAVNMECTGSRYVPPWNIVNVYWCVRGIFCLYNQRWTVRQACKHGLTSQKAVIILPCSKLPCHFPRHNMMHK